MTTVAHPPSRDPLPAAPASPALSRARHKAMWEAGDFGRVARHTVPTAEEFMGRAGLRPGWRVLDLACGTGNLAVIAARLGCLATGLDLAANLLAQAEERAKQEGLLIQFDEGDAEALPYQTGSFDLVASMFGVMFAPQPEKAAAELLRVTRPGGRIMLANWTPESFIGRMFEVFARYAPAAENLPSPLLWGRTAPVINWLGRGVKEMEMTRRTARLRYPFDAEGTVEFFRQYYGPMQRAFALLDQAGQRRLRHELENLQAGHNQSREPHCTEVAAEYLEIRAVRED